MAIINVPKTDTFDIWRQKTNQIALLEGDLTLLTLPAPDLVTAINNILALIDDKDREVLIRAIAMA